MSIVDFAPIRVEPAPSRAALRGADLSRSEAPDLKAQLEAYERQLILGALAGTGGHQRNAARRLRVLPSTLHEKMKRLGIRLDRVRDLRAPAGSDVQAALVWRGRVASGGTLEVRGLNGRVRVDASDDDQAEVSATHGGPRSARSPIELRVVEHGHGVSVVCQRPERAATGLAEPVVSAAIDLVARVPPGVHVIASTINGDVEVVGLAGNVEATTTNGHVVFLPAAG